MNEVRFVENLVDSYIKNRSKKALFIQDYTFDGADVDEFIKTAASAYDVKVIYHKYQRHCMKEAYEPFLPWIRDFYYENYEDKYSLNEFVAECGVYSLQRDVIASYIKTNRCKREFDVMVEEYDYEKERMIKSIGQSMEFLAKDKPIVIIIDRLHMAPYSVMQTIDYMLNNESNVYFVFAYDERVLVKSYCSSMWRRLIDFAESGNMILEANDDNKEKQLGYPDDFLFVEDELEEYIRKLFNMLHTFAFYDIRYYMDIVQECMARTTKEVSSLTKFYLQMIIANAEIGLSNCKDALFACESMLPLLSELNNLNADYVYNYLLAKAQLIMSELERVREFCKTSKEIARKLNNEKLLMNVEVIETIASYGSLKEMFKCDYTQIIDENVIQRVKKFNNENFLAYLYVFGYDNDEDAIKAIGNGERESEYFNKGVEIAKKLDNRILILMAYMKHIIVYSEHGYYKYVTKMYEKRLSILDKDNKIRWVHAYNGLGYNCVVLEEHTKADEYFKKAIEILVQEQSAEDMAETLYNMLMNYYVAGVYDKAIECGELIFKIMDMIGIQTIRICNASKLYGFLVLANFKLRQYYESYYFFDKMENVLSYILEYGDDESEKLWYNDLFLYYLCKANISMYEKKYEEAEVYFDKAKWYMDVIKGDGYYSYVEYAASIYNLYTIMGKDKEKQKIIDEALEFCKANGYTQKIERLNALREGKEYIVQYDSAGITLPIRDIINMCTFVGAKVEIEQRDRDIDFLALSQDTMIREQNSVLELIENSVSIIQNTYNFDRIVLLEKIDGKCAISHVSGAIKLNTKDCTEIFEFFEKYRTEFLSSRTDRSFNIYTSLLEKFNIGQIVTAVGIPIYKESYVSRVFIGIVDVHRSFTNNRKFLNRHNLTVLKYAVSQLDEAIKRIKNNCMIKAMNHELEKSSITDTLTGIYNRMGMHKIVSDGIGKEGIVLYLDLDYFKKYNDTYGHSVGDIILSRFARILEDSLKNIGYAVRYGGDEFVAIIPGKKEAFGKEVATKINCLFKKDYDIQVAIEGQPVSASIGVAEYEEGTDEGLEAALKLADEALYDVKNTTRGRVAVWSEIKGQI